MGAQHVHVDRELAEKLNGQEMPVVRVHPGTEQEVATVLRMAEEKHWKLAVVGAGTQLSFGNTPDTVDVALLMDRFNTIVDHSPADMVVTVQAGVKFSELQAFLAEYRQMLAVDPVVHDDATIGGLVATAVSGPMRVLYGTLRDMLIGTRVVTPEGQTVRTGSKVVKNVAGYDVSKLFIGSLGTLGVLTECTFKLKPLPSHRELCALRGTLEQMDSVRSAVMDSVLIPSSMELVGSRDMSSLFLDAGGDGPWSLLIGCDEDAASAAFQTSTLEGLAKNEGAGFTVCNGVQAERFWDGYRQTLLSAPLVVRVQHSPDALCQLVADMRTVAESAGVVTRVSFALSVGVGRIYCWPGHGDAGGVLSSDGATTSVESTAFPSEGTLHSSEGTPPSFSNEAEVFGALQKIVADVGAACVIERGSVKLRREFNAFYSKRTAETEMALMRAIKEMFDPGHLLSPGRFAGGI